MKKVLLILMLSVLSISNSFAQDENSEFKQFQKVFEMDNTSGKEIYSKIKTWIALYFKSANDVIQLDDPENGKIIEKCIYSTYYKKWGTHEMNIYTATTFDIKDNKFRCTIDVLDIRTGTSMVSVYSYFEKKSKQTGMKEMRKALYERIDEVFASLESLNSVDDKNDDW